MNIDVCGQPAHSTGGRTTGCGIHGAARGARAGSRPAFSKPARTTSGENSPVRGKSAPPAAVLPATARPSDCSSRSISGSSSSTTTTRCTDAQKLAQQVGGERPRRAELQHARGRQHFAHVRVARARGDDAQRRVARLDPVQRRVAQELLRAAFALEQRARGAGRACTGIITFLARSSTKPRDGNLASRAESRPCCACATGAWSCGRSPACRSAPTVRTRAA